MQFIKLIARAADVADARLTMVKITEDYCWDFFADHMAPFTAPRHKSNDSASCVEFNHESACQLIQDFLECLGHALS